MSLNDPNDWRTPDSYLVGPDDDGVAWELGWDRSIGAYYAQRVILDDDDRFIDEGAKVYEPAVFERLADHIGRPIPPDVVQGLIQQAVTFTGQNGTDPPLADWIASVYLHIGITPQWALPAEPVADYLHDRQLELDITPGQMAAGLGMDPDLVAGLMSGTITELNVDQIGHVCESLRCSPFDMWGSNTARTILHAYGPEQWPRYIEPLEDSEATIYPARTPVERISDLRDQLRAATDRTSDHQAVVEHTAPSGSGAVVTPYFCAGVFAMNADGELVEGWEAATAFENIETAFLKFQQVADPQPTLIREPSPESQLAEDAASQLEWFASSLAAENENPFADEVELVRFTWASGKEHWIGWNRQTEAWEEWNDPRRGYPGPASHVLDSGRHVSPEEWLTRSVPTIDIHDEPTHMQVAPAFIAGSDVIVTGYHRTAVFAVTDLGQKLSVEDAAPYLSYYEYHYRFEQVTRPSIYPLFGAEEASAGEGVDPLLASVASYRVSDADRGAQNPDQKIDMVRISPTQHGGYNRDAEEAWLGWHPESKTWELWDDPRPHYPGPPIDVLDPGANVEPERWDATKEVEAITAHDSHGLSELVADTPTSDEPQWTPPWPEELPGLSDDPGLEL